MVSIRERVEKIAGADKTPPELRGIPKLGSNPGGLDTAPQPEQDPHPLAPYLCPSSRGSHRFQAVNDLGDKCKLCALWRDPTLDYESPLGLTKREIPSTSPKVKAPRGWTRVKSAIGL